MYQVDAHVMRSLETAAIDGGVSRRELICNAVRGATRIIGDILHNQRFRRIVVLAGTGINAVDAVEVAKGLDLPATIYIVDTPERYAEELVGALDSISGHATIIPRMHLSESDFLFGDLIIDGLLGIGFHGFELKSPYDVFIKAANSTKLPIVSIDIPSGITPDTGVSARNGAIDADVTITLGYPKSGLFCNDGIEHCGKLRLVRLPIPLPDNARNDLFTFDDAFEIMPRNRYDVHKGQAGRLAIFAGCAGYVGAPVLAAAASMHAGCGYVRLVTDAPVPSCPWSLIKCGNPDNSTELDAIVDSSDAIVCGPGWGVRNRKEIFRSLVKSGRPLLIDADAIRILAEEMEISKEFRENVVLTPHAGELAALFDALDMTRSGNREADAVRLARAVNAVIVYKGPYTIVAAPDGRYSINTSGCNKLATAGSGDVLSGIIGRFMTKLSAFDAARLGVFVHGLAPEYIDYIGTADDLLRAVGKVVDDIRLGIPPMTRV